MWCGSVWTRRSWQKHKLFFLKVFVWGFKLNRVLNIVIVLGMFEDCSCCSSALSGFCRNEYLIGENCLSQESSLTAHSWRKNFCNLVNENREIYADKHRCLIILNCCKNSQLNRKKWNMSFFRRDREFNRHKSLEKWDSSSRHLCAAADPFFTKFTSSSSRESIPSRSLFFFRFRCQTKFFLFAKKGENRIYKQQQRTYTRFSSYLEWYDERIFVIKKEKHEKSLSFNERIEYADELS